MRIILTLLLLTLSASLSAQTATSTDANEWVVVFDDPRPARLQGWVRSEYGKTSGNYQSSVELKRFSKKMASKYKVELRDEWFIESLGVYCLVVAIGQNESETLSKLRQNKSVQWVQPSNEFELFASSLSKARAVEQSYSESEISLPDSVNGEGVVIAIIDSAVDENHQDLIGTIRKSDDFVVAGEDNVGGEAHGTAIAGVMSTQPGSKLGVEGVSPAAKLELYRACWESSDNQNTNCNTLSLARALDSVIRSDADILNLSLSGPKDFLLDQLIARIVGEGKMVVAAFDPTRVDGDRFPSERNGVLIVRAHGLDSAFAEVFTAPGARVVPVPGNGYNFMHGHSVATAYTSGLLALRKQAIDTNLPGISVQTNWRDTSQSKFAHEIVRELTPKS